MGKKRSDTRREGGNLTGKTRVWLHKMRKAIENFSFRGITSRAFAAQLKLCPFKAAVYAGGASSNSHSEAGILLC